MTDRRKREWEDAAAAVVEAARCVRQGADIDEIDIALRRLDELDRNPDTDIPGSFARFLSSPDRLKAWRYLLCIDPPYWLRLRDIPAGLMHRATADLGHDKVCGLPTTIFGAICDLEADARRFEATLHRIAREVYQLMSEAKADNEK